jgi:hypothetical protein
MPRATEHRIYHRVMALRDEAAAINAAHHEAFWDAVYWDAPGA